MGGGLAIDTSCADQLRFEQALRTVIVASPDALRVEQVARVSDSASLVENGTTIGRANIDGTGANQAFVDGAIGPCGVAVETR